MEKSEKISKQKNFRTKKNTTKKVKKILNGIILNLAIYFISAIFGNGMFFFLQFIKIPLFPSFIISLMESAAMLHFITLSLNQSKTQKEV